MIVGCIIRLTVTTINYFNTMLKVIKTLDQIVTN